MSQAEEQKSDSVASHTASPCNSIERILCAAIWFNDGNNYEHQPENITEGFVISGRRHSNCYSTLASIGKALKLEEKALTMVERIERDCQGFITNTNRFVDRKEGYQIAKAANQLLIGEHEPEILISEDLY